MSQHYGLHVPVPQRAWHEQNWKLVLQADGFTELYDLESDPQEMHNLAASAGYRPCRTALRRALGKAMAAVGDNLDLS